MGSSGGQRGGGRMGVAAQLQCSTISNVAQIFRG